MILQFHHIVKLFMLFFSKLKMHPLQSILHMDGCQPVILSLSPVCRLQMKDSESNFKALQQDIKQTESCMRGNIWLRLQHKEKDWWDTVRGWTHSWISKLLVMYYAPSCFSSAQTITGELWDTSTSWLTHPSTPSVHPCTRTARGNQCGKTALPWLSSSIFMAVVTDQSSRRCVRMNPPGENVFFSGLI